MAHARATRILSLLLVSLALAGCDLVGDILEFGFWAIVIVVAVIIALIVWGTRRLRGPRRGPPPPPAV